MMLNLPFATFTPVSKSSHQLSGSPAPETPVRVVVDSIAASTLDAALASYAESGMVPHFTVGFGDNSFVAQHLDLGQSAIKVSSMPMETHKIGRTIWVMVLKPGNTPPCTSESYWLGQTIGKIAEAVGAPEYWESFPERASSEYKTSQMTAAAWSEFEGICAAGNVPFCSRYGPGDVDLWAFGEGLSSSDSSSTLKVDAVEAVATLSEPAVVDLLAAEFAENLEAAETVLGDFPGRKVQLGSGGQAVDALRAAYGLDEGKFDDELHDLVLAVQEKSGLTADGIVDSTVWAVLDQSLIEEN